MESSTSFPVELSLWVATWAVLVAAPLGAVLAYLQVRRRLPFPAVVDGLILFPMIIPPSVVGFLLVWVLGRRGILGAWLEDALGLRLTFTPLAAIIASVVVSLPIMVKSAEAALQGVPLEMENVARSLGLHPIQVFFRVSVPAAWRGLVAALVLTFARAMGEFGATLMFAGNIPGQTNTMPLEIFARFQAGDDAHAALYVGVLCAISAVVVVVSARLSPRRASA